MMPRAIKIALVAFLQFLPRTLAACSPALRLDQEAERAAFYAALERPFYAVWGLSAAAALTWLVIVHRRRMAPGWAHVLAVTLVALAVGQPAWWMETMSGDCGSARDLAAIGVASLSTLLLALGVWRLRRVGRSVSGPEATARGYTLP